jgi:hypothetical protein
MTQLNHIFKVLASFYEAAEISGTGSIETIIFLPRGQDTHSPAGAGAGAAFGPLHHCNSC